MKILNIDDPKNYVSGNIPKEDKQRLAQVLRIHVHRGTGLCTIPKRQKQLRCPSIGKVIKLSIYMCVHRVACFQSLKVRIFEHMSEILTVLPNIV